MAKLTSAQKLIKHYKTVNKAMEILASRYATAKTEKGRLILVRLSMAVCGYGTMR